MSEQDTIVAPITGHPPAAVAWVRLSGPEAWRIASRVFSPWPSEPEPQRAFYGRHASGDDGLALPFAAGHSYTGEETVELSMHGSRASIEAVVGACLASGARLAEPGEFTRRAFMNGRLDLSQAEAVRESCEARIAAQLRVASRLREGALRDRVDALRVRLIRQMAALEASVDFSEEIGEFDREGAAQEVEACRRELETLLQGARAGRILREGYRIAIVGPPNAGKSSLLNALLGLDRAIVTDVPGTTRDFIEEAASFGDTPVVLIDTAGLRDAEETVEAIGIQRSRAQASGADEVWYVFDAAVGYSERDAAWVRSIGRPVEIVANKCDLAPAGVGHPVSARTGEGLVRLTEGVRERAGVETPELLVNPRQSDVLARAQATVEELARGLRSEAPDDLLSVLFSQAILELGEITGETASPDMLDRIFRDFCIGK